MNFDPPTNDEIDESKDRQISGLEQILGSMDVDTEDLIRLVTAIGALKKNKKGVNEQTKEQEENKVFLDKTFVLGRDDVYIYRDNRTKKKGWYIRIYEARYRKHWGKSLKTTKLFSPVNTILWTAYGMFPLPQLYHCTDYHHQKCHQQPRLPM